MMIDHSLREPKIDLDSFEKSIEMHSQKLIKPDKKV
jgi:hypothetical protein